MEHKEQRVICQNCKSFFIIESKDFTFYERIKVPPPTFCPLCRAQRRFAFRNERKLFKVKDFFTGKDIFSLYPIESGKKIITQEEWNSDSWDALEYGCDFDFSKIFLKQLKELEMKVPIFNLNADFMVDSPYSGNATGLKRCYLCFNSNYSENCMYGNGVDYSKDCVDNSHIKQCEKCYDSFWSRNCYQCHFTRMSSDCRNMWFCQSCSGCNDCFGCVNLRQSSYCIFNKKYSKEEYQKKIKEMRLDTISGINKARLEARNFTDLYPVKFQEGIRNLNSNGSYVTDCKNVENSFLIRESENLRYCQYLQVPKSKDCYDASIWGNNLELAYETCVCGENSYNNKFCFNCWPSCKDIEYCIDLFSCSDCFGCVGLKKKQYCILNKQYTKEDYFKLVEKIKTHMNDMPYVDSQGLIYKYGEFFPIEFSYIGYNNSIAIQFFPLNKEEAKDKGYFWVDKPKGEYKITKKVSDLPESVRDVDDSILKEIFECEKCGSAYRILENEFIFLQGENIPIPDLCNDCRHERRISDRLKLELFDRHCMCMGEDDETKKYKNTVSHSHGNSKCIETFKTGYKLDSGKIIYCEDCYNKEVY